MTQLTKSYYVFFTVNLLQLFRYFQSAIRTAIIYDNNFIFMTTATIK